MNYKTFLRSAFFVFLIFGLTPLQAQYLVPLHHDYNRLIDKEHTRSGKAFHSVMRPYLKAQVNEFTNFDSLLLRHRHNSSNLSLFHRKLRHEHLLYMDTTDFEIYFDVLFNQQLSMNTSTDERFYTNTRGFTVGGKITDKLAFQTYFYENQAAFPEYLDTYINEYEIIPGQGRGRVFNEDGFDYAYSQGFISYTPSPYFNLQLGHGKHFVGDGYRSLLLSDHSFNYPYFKITTTIWRFQYVNLFTAFTNFVADNIYVTGFQKKYGSFHLLSYNITDKLELSLFEGIVWQGSDSAYHRGIDVNYLNPIIFYRPVEFSLGSPDNAFLGANLRYNATRNWQLYGQFALDDFDFARSDEGDDFILNKFGFQLGSKLFDVFGISNLSWQAEYNQVRPYTYSHRTVTQNYAHYNEALAHPIGANFREVINILRYSYNDWNLQLKYNYAVYGVDTASSNWGGNIFLSERNATLGPRSYGNEILQGVRTTLQYADVNISYMINPLTNMQLTAGMIIRREENDLATSNLNLFYISWKTALFNYYYDW